MRKTKYLRHKISSEGISMNSANVATVREWAPPESVKGVQTLLGLGSFYRQFIQEYSEVFSPLTKLTKKGIKLVRTLAAETAFQLVKEAYTTASVLLHFDPQKPIILEKDAFDYVTAGVLSQHDDASILHPLTFYSKKHSRAECNYEIYDK